MKNILKLSVLIAGFALCMVEDQEETKATITVVNALSGEQFTVLEVPVSTEGRFTKFALTRIFEQDYESKHPTELGKVMDAPSLITGDNKISNYPDDTTFSIEQVINVVCSEQKVTLHVRNDSDATCTLYGNLKAISNDELAPYDSLEGYIRDLQTKCPNIHNLFLGGSSLLVDLISTYLTKITTSSGQVFIKRPERSILPGDRRESALNLLYAIYYRAELQAQVTQENIDVINQSNAWVIAPTIN